MGHALTWKVGLLLLACPVTGARDKGHRNLELKWHCYRSDNCCQLYHLAGGLVNIQCNIVPLGQLLKCFKEFLTVSLGLDFFTIKQRKGMLPSQPIESARL